MIDKKALYRELDQLNSHEKAELRDQYKGPSFDDIVRKNLERHERIRALAAPPVRRNMSFKRRRFLQTMGASALVAPFLGTKVLSLGSAKAQMGEKDNLLLIDWPCGMEPNWTPKGTGKDYMVDDKGPGQGTWGTEPQMKTLVETHKDKILILSGWEGLVGTDLYSHSQGPTSMWTNWTGGAPTKGLSAVASLDEILGAKYKGERPFSVLHAGVLSLFRETGASGIAVPYFHWSGPQQPAQAEDDPGKLYMDIAGNLATAAPSAAVGNTTMASPDMGDALKAKQKSVIDYVMNELTGAKNKVGREDLIRLDEHLTRVRDLEQKLFGKGGGGSAGGATGAPIDCGNAMGPDAALTGEAATRSPKNAAETSKAHAQILALAFKCGLTKVATLQLGESDCMFTIPYEGSTRPMHLASHNMGDGNDAQTRWVATRWMMDRVTDIITIFANTPMGDGTTLLDKTLIVGTSEMSIQEHLDKNMPYVIAGGSSGTFKMKRGEHVALPATYRISKMNYSILEYFGEDASTLPSDPSGAGGDTKGSLEEIKG